MHSRGMLFRFVAQRERVARSLRHAPIVLSYPSQDIAAVTVNGLPGSFLVRAVGRFGNQEARTDVIDEVPKARTGSADDHEVSLTQQNPDQNRVVPGEVVAKCFRWRERQTGGRGCDDSCANQHVSRALACRSTDEVQLIESLTMACKGQTKRRIQSSWSQPSGGAISSTSLRRTK